MLYVHGVLCALRMVCAKMYIVYILCALRTWCVLKCIWCIYYMLYVHGVY